MAKKIQQHKKASVAALRSLLDACHNYVLVDYRGLTVRQITSLRGQLSEVGAKFHVVKNNYLKIALEQEGKLYAEDSLKGPTALAVLPADASIALKAIVGFPEPLEMKSGVMDGALFDAARLVEFSKLPGKTELIAQLLGAFNAPAQQTVGVLNAAVLQLLSVLNALNEKIGGKTGA